MIQGVQAAAPDAKIVVTGYPYLYDPVPLDSADPMSAFIAQATRLTDGLNGTIYSAAKATGAEYVDVRAAFAGHGIDSAEPWINLDLADLGSADNFHPNAQGYGAYFASLSASGTYSTPQRG